MTALGGVASAGNPPSGPGNIEIFVKRDMVALEGYSEQAGQKATVTVTRGGEQIGIAQGTIDDTGFLEFNHPGGECWIGVTPNITKGDTIEVSFNDAAFTDGAVVGSAEIKSIEATGTPTPDVPDDFEAFVTISGTYGADIDPARFVVEVINPEMREAGSAVGERAIGWVPNDDPADPANGGPGFSSTGTFADGKFSATFGFLSASDQQLAMEGEHVALSWMADGDGDLALGATQYEAGETDGPGFGGCPAGPGAQPPVGPSTAQLSSGSTSLDVSWSAPAQPADGTPINGYRVSAVGGDFANQEVAVRTNQTSAILQGLKSGATYEVFIEATNGLWSAPESVGSVVVGAGSPGGGTGGEEPPGEVTALPLAVQGVTATSATLDSVDVSWTGSPAAEQVTAYTVTATADGSTVATLEVLAPATSARLTGLASGREFDVAVTATNALGAGDPGTAKATTLATAAPSAFAVTRVLPGHERVAVEWTAARPGNAASPVTGYEVIATPATGSPVSTAVTGLTGTVSGLTNGVEYTVSVVATSGSATTTGTAGSGVTTKVKPNDAVTVGRAEYRADKREYRVSGTAQDTTANTVTVRTNSGQLVQLGVPVGADGAWSISTRNGPVLATGATLTITSTSGALLERVAVTRR
jgi:hypothetical protein